VRRQEVPEPEPDEDEPDEEEPDEDELGEDEPDEELADEDEEESLLGAVVVLEDDASPDDFSEALGARVELLPARESVR